MTIYTALQKGEYHLHHCEDYLFTGNIGDDKIICAVMDGCTMGTDSYFASTLTGKLLRKIIKSMGYKELYNKQPLFDDVESYLKYVLQQLLAEIVIAKNQLLLERDELLTTLMLLLIDKPTNSGIILVIGDGVVSVNGLVTEFDQDNKPDYIGYHLSENFEEWYKGLKQKISIKNIRDVSIATDGIATFKPIAAMIVEDSIDPLYFLLNDDISGEDEDVLERKLRRLEHVYGLNPTDDLAVIRVIR